jgi:thymidine kinase
MRAPTLPSRSKRSADGQALFLLCLDECGEIDQPAAGRFQLSRARFAAGTVTSRIGLGADAIAFERDTDLIAIVHRDGEALPACVLVDEAQFLTGQQVDQLAHLADVYGVPVLAYGLRTDFLGELFEGSARLLAIADSLVEIKSVCVCGRKATMNLRVDASGLPIAEGRQTEIGGNNRYVALCRRHFNEALGAKG